MQFDNDSEKENWYIFDIKDLFPFEYDSNYILCLNYANNNIMLADKVYQTIDIYELYYKYTLKLAANYKKAKPKK